LYDILVVSDNLDSGDVNLFCIGVNDPIDVSDNLESGVMNLFCIGVIESDSDSESDLDSVKLLKTSNKKLIIYINLSLQLYSFRI